MAVRVQQHQVWPHVCATVDAPWPMREVPSYGCGHRVVAHRTAPWLLPPELHQLPSPLQGFLQVSPWTGFNGSLPVRVIRIGLAPEFDVPSNQGVTPVQQPHGLWRSSRLGARHAECPPPRRAGGAVLLLQPGAPLRRMSALHPAPRVAIDRMAHIRTRFFAHPGPMIVRPARDDRVERPDQRLDPGVQVPCEDGSDVRQHALHARVRRCDQQLPVIRAPMNAWKVEAFSDVRDAGLGR